MLAFRLVRKKYANPLSDEGASRSGNRWNSKGTALIYCADSRALAMAEVAVHLSLGLLPKDYEMVELEIPDEVSLRSLAPANLPVGWNNFPHLIPTQRIGDEFVAAAESCVLQVPSAVVPGDFNYLLNPAHPDFERIQIKSRVDFPFDSRFFGI
jgi:RES domain-containing protein